MWSEGISYIIHDTNVKWIYFHISSCLIGSILWMHTGKRMNKGKEDTSFDISDF